MPAVKLFCAPRSWTKFLIFQGSRKTLQGVIISPQFNSLTKQDPVDRKGEKMKKCILSVIFVCMSALPAIAANGIISVRSAFDVAETTDRLERILEEKGMTVFNRIHHSEGARGVGIELRDTQLLIFGNPKVGSPLIKCQQTAALDLPQKALIWKDDKGVVSISYNDPAYIQIRHAVSGCEDVFEKIDKALSIFVEKAAAN